MKNKTIQSTIKLPLFLGLMSLQTAAFGDSLIGGNRLDCQFTGSGKWIAKEFNCQLENGEDLVIKTSRKGSCLRKLHYLAKDAVAIVEENSPNNAQVQFAFNRTQFDPVTLRIKQASFEGSEIEYPIFLNIHFPPSAISESGTHQTIGSVKVNGLEENVTSCSIQSKVVETF